MACLDIAAQPLHGYAILKNVESFSDGRVKLSTGTLYGALSRLLDDAWIDRVEEESAPRGRQTYRLTAAGRRIVRSEVARLQQLPRVAAAQLKPRELLRRAIFVARRNESESGKTARLSRGSSAIRAFRRSSRR